MKSSSLQNKYYFLMVFVCNHFFITKYLLYFLYQIASDQAIYYLLFSIFLILISTYYLIKKDIFPLFFELKKTQKKCLSLFLFFLQLFSIITLTHFIKIHWLINTPLLFILIPFYSLIYYGLKQPLNVLYKTLGYLFPILLITLSLFYFKKLAYLSLINVNLTFTNHSFIQALFLSLFIFLQAHFALFIPIPSYFQVSKKSYLYSIFVLIFLILLETWIETNEFSTLLEIIRFPFFESFNTIYFGQYIGYQHIPVLFIYLIGAFFLNTTSIHLFDQINTPSRTFVFFILNLILCFLFLQYETTFQGLLYPLLGLTYFFLFLSYLFYFIRK